MLPVRNVQIRWIILALSVNQITIFNLIKILVLIPAPRHPTSPIVNSKYVSHVMKPVKFVLARQKILALFVTQRTFSNWITKLVLKHAIKATTVSLPATHERHVIQLVPNVQVQD
jgi:hypothetical protein